MHIPPDTPLSHLRFVAFDTETTGLSPVAARLVELSGVKFSAEGHVESSFSELIDPELDIPPESTAIHGITNDMVAGKPRFQSVVPAFFSWVGEGSTVLVAHNAPFDLGFLEVAMAKLGIAGPDLPVLDTLHLSRRLLTDAPNHQLRTLIGHLGLEPGEYHRALADSHHVRSMLIKLLALVPEITTWGELSSLTPMIFFNNLSAQGIEQLKEMPTGFESIRDAIDGNIAISMVYNNGSSATRVVTPQSVHAWRGAVYMNAYCHSAQAERTFRMDKIVRFQLLAP